MPILDIDIIGEPAPDSDAALASRLAEVAACVFVSEPRHTWVRIHYTPASHYAENSAGSPADVTPVFVRVLKYRRPDTATLRDEIQRLTEAIARECRRPSDQIHIIYEPDAAGRIAFGGELVD